MNDDDTVNGNIIVYGTLNLGSANISINGNIEVRGILNLTGTTNLTFTGSPRYIYVYPGGKIYIDDTAGFNK